MDFHIPPFFGVTSTIIGLIVLASFWTIFKKAGRLGWEGIIPIYNAYILLKIVGKPGWWLILFLFPLVGLIFGIWTLNMLSRSFGKSEAFTIGLVLLPVIFFPILAFGDSKYLVPFGDPMAFQLDRR